MNTKYTSGKLLLLVAGLIIFIYGCNKTKEYLLTEEMRNTIPFTGKEKVSFLFDNDTLVIISDFRINAQYRTSCGRFNQDYCLVEINKINFFGEKHHYYYDVSNGPDFQHSGELDIYWEYGSSLESFGAVAFKLPLTKKNLNSHQSYIDQLEVLGKMYYEVYCDTGVKSENRSLQLFCIFAIPDFTPTPFSHSHFTCTPTPTPTSRTPFSGM